MFADPYTVGYAWLDWGAAVGGAGQCFVFGRNCLTQARRPHSGLEGRDGSRWSGWLRNPRFDRFDSLNRDAEASR